MKKFILLVAYLLVFSNIYASQNSQIDAFIKDVDAFMSTYVDHGTVDYQRIMVSDKDRLLGLVDQLGSMKVIGESNHAKAFYINAYNVLVISKIIELYPIKSPLDHNGFFDKNKFLIAGEKLTLNDLENKKIRAIYKDPRIHFAVVCAAKGCPSLQSFAYMPDQLDMQLDKVTKESMDSNYFIRYHPSAVVEISKIFSWYKEDFGGNNKGFIDYINKYRTDKIATSVKVSFYAYDWDLNSRGN